MGDILPTSAYALNRLPVQLPGRIQLDFANSPKGIYTSDETQLPHVSLGERGHLFGQANDNAVEASLVLAVHSADQAEGDRCSKRDR